MPTTYRECSICGAERAFEQPPCDDGHGGDCPDWVCAECGAAIFIGDPPAEAGTVAVSAA